MVLSCPVAPVGSEFELARRDMTDGSADWATPRSLVSEPAVKIRLSVIGVAREVFANRIRGVWRGGVELRFLRMGIDRGF